MAVFIYIPERKFLIKILKSQDHQNKSTRTYRLNKSLIYCQNKFSALKYKYKINIDTRKSYHVEKGGLF